MTSVPGLRSQTKDLRDLAPPIIFKQISKVKKKKLVSYSFVRLIIMRKQQVFANKKQIFMFLLYFYN